MTGGNHLHRIERLPTGPDSLLDEAAEMMIAFFDTYVVGGPDRVGEVAARLRASGYAEEQNRILSAKLFLRRS